MANKKMSAAGKGVLAGIKDAIAFIDGDATRGKIMFAVDVAAIRNKIGLSQGAFAELLDIPAPTLRKWEQGQRSPTGAARTLLLMFDADPKAATRMLRKAKTPIVAAAE